MQKNMNR